MKTSLSIGAVLRRTLRVYTQRAPTLLAAALLVEVVVTLDQVQRGRSTLTIATALVNLVVFALFACVVVLVAADTWDSGARPSAGELLRGAWSALGRLLLPGVVACLAFILLPGTLVLMLAFAIPLGLVHAAGVLILALLLVSVLTLVPELFLITIWSVFPAVVVLERPRGLRALGRSRELVRGNSGRVLALVLTLTLPLALLTSAVDGVAHTVGGAPAFATRLLWATVIVPIPVLVATALYFELRQAKPTPVPAGPAPPVPPPEALAS
jgi:hypothetical protein